MKHLKKWITETQNNIIRLYSTLRYIMQWGVWRDYKTLHSFEEVFQSLQGYETETSGYFGQRNLYLGL